MIMLENIVHFFMELPLNSEWVNSVTPYFEHTEHRVGYTPIVVLSKVGLHN